MNLEENIQLLQDKSAENQFSYSVKSNKQVGPKGQFCGSKVRPLSINKHRRGKRRSVQAFKTSFCWIGNNIAGARSKWALVKRWIRMKSPAILTLQETKFQVAGRHKIDGYIVYEHLRSEKTAGGGILMAIVKDLNPALVRDGGVDVEALTVDINVKKMQISCTTAYGPQEKDSKIKKDNFCQYLDEEAKRADEEGKGFILQGDLNSYVKDYSHAFVIWKKVFLTFLWCVKESLVLLKALSLMKIAKIFLLIIHK